MIQKFRKKSAIIEAAQISPETYHEIKKWTDGKVYVSPVLEPTDDNPKGEYWQISTFEGVMTAIKGDWIVKCADGDFIPCKPGIFEKTYEPIGNHSVEANKMVLREAKSITEDELADFIYESGLCASKEYWERPRLTITNYDEVDGVFFSYHQKQKPGHNDLAISTNGILKLGDNPHLFTEKHGNYPFRLEHINYFTKRGFAIPIETFPPQPKVGGDDVTSYKEEQKQNIIEIMHSDEESGLYKEEKDLEASNGNTDEADVATLRSSSSNTNQQ